PAESRIRRLAAETPATLILFDQLAGPSGILLDSPLVNRREALEEFYRRNLAPQLKLSPFTHERRTAQSWLKTSGGAIDGVVCKRLDGVYTPGRRTMLKVKCLRTADCVVGGFRYLEREHLVGSLLLGLYNRQGELDHVGFTSAIAAADREALTERLQSLAKPPGFTGKAPGGPSRWATGRSTEWVPLKPVLVAEVQYDQITGGRFRHGTKFLRWRPDKAPKSCTLASVIGQDQPQHGTISGAPDELFCTVLSR
ncbi:MAG: ATP-dependent DNA ligase, partial [Rhodomicrobium sp.]